MARWIAAFVTASCIASSPPAQPNAQPATPPETRAAIQPRALAPGPRPVPSVPAQQLLVATDQLDTARARLDRASIVRALYALGDALEAVAPEHPNEILRVRQVTNELSRSEPRADAEAELVRIALDAATRALANVKDQPETDRGRLAEATDALRDATDHIDRDRPLRSQYPAVRSAFHASVRAVYAATGAPDPEIANPPTTARR